ncbi:lithocholate 6-beta-hydroxylase isoform X3 [Dermacentor silvarum]|uniref:lithocholate 6-beta-hydroxylase isoform X3 n=1 Tax=Dermacentor silvarum TaxID=543639 RepID=UPI002100994E|nr:lithocholate 6-beta-hydroxylase isoform X3 [Dermacentor silvarum]
MAAKLSLLSYEAISWTTIAIIVTYALFRLVRSRQKTFSYFNEIGIPGPEPSLLWGNLAEYHKKSFVHALTDWCAKYGDVFGFYNGDLPMLVVKDLDFVTYIFVENFQNFTDRGIVMRAEQEHASLGKSVTHSKGANWRRMRGCISQAFTSNKLKHARKPDLLQIMLDASIQKKHSSDAGEKTKGSMTRLEVEVNTTMTLLAGFETTSTALTYVSYVLAKYQDIQEKVRAEVASAVEEYGELNYDSVMLRMKYLRRVVDETLRIYPPGTVFTTRRALNDFDYNGIKFKAGTSFMAPTLQIHMDLRYWPEPHRFDPDRFLPENASSRPSVAYQPFGVGPRNCFGERLAILEIMYTMARMVEKYRLTLGESQKNDLELCFRATVSAPREGPYIKFQRI